MDPEIIQFVEQMIKLDILKFGQFTLKSGDTSPFYIDLRLIPSYPELFQTALELLSNVCQANNLTTDHFAGLISAGVPFATGLVLRHQNSLLQIRSTAKQHGRKKIIEGKYSSRDHVVLIDDLISTGASKIPALEELQEKRLSVDAILVLIDRRTSEEIGSDLNGIPLYSVLNIHDIVEVVKKSPKLLGDMGLDDFLSKISTWVD